ncbi:fatty acid desaturase 2 [Plakobranchus ocellatus]|uniref:Fatty acid desaturase 2 n=1 Tax=Plakobranchus ocellatus TaxID=259542 RepID=A0AAV3ZB96_9GAST|nr:fatty acid desaturase 2 [Plakobranchus ocellatus]
MGKGAKAANGNCHAEPRQITFEELSKHNKKEDQWLMIDRKAYNITEFAKRHPGGAKILNHYAGEDATDAWTAFHNDKEKVSKYLKSVYVGDVIDAPESELQADFRRLRELVEKNGWMEPEWFFYVWNFVHVIALEVAAVWVLYYFGTGIIPILTSMVLLATSQAQSGWTQHDYGHHSVFKDLKRSHIFHHITVGLIKGASSHWWNFRHFQHHAKPNRVRKDPDIDIAYLFMIGDNIPVEWGKKKRGKMPYQFQHKYFFFLGPPLLLPIYFHFEIIYFCLKRKDWLDFSLAILYFYRLGYMFGPLLGGWGTFFFYMGMRFIESHWFTWVTQMSHLPNDVNRDNEQMDWVTMQLKTTCNVEPGPFNDWFTGHLNYQIEHHLFPTMPRTSFHKVQPLVMSLCKKHGLEYRNKTLYNAFADIVRMLKKSGQLWYDAYYE